MERVKTRYSANYTDVLAAIEYSGNARPAMWRLKDDGDRRTVRFFAKEMERAVNEHWDDIVFDVIIPVPMNPKKKSARGFNQAELLAEYLSKLMRIPMVDQVMIRQEGMQTQHKLSAVKRLENAEKSYIVNMPSMIKNRTILVVDDLLTTGATMDVCARKLLETGARAVYVIAAEWTNNKK